MDAFLSFLMENWKFIVEVFLLLVSFIVLLLKKKNKVNISSSVISDLLVKLPGWINEAESFKDATGEGKLKLVLGKAIEFLVEETGLSEKEVLRSYGNNIIDCIEDVLSTPQKKGDQ